MSPDELKDLVIAKVGDIPVGGGRVFPETKVVVTQPAEGTFRAFSAVCTHMGCTVGRIRGGLIRCPCHGSAYDPDTGENKEGPAPRPLTSYPIRVDGDDLVLG